MKTFLPISLCLLLSSFASFGQKNIFLAVDRVQKNVIDLNRKIIETLDDAERYRLAETTLSNPIEMAVNAVRELEDSLLVLDRVSRHLQNNAYHDTIMLGRVYHQAAVVYMRDINLLINSVMHKDGYLESLYTETQEAFSRCQQAYYVLLEYTQRQRMQVESSAGFLLIRNAITPLLYTNKQFRDSLQLYQARQMDVLRSIQHSLTIDSLTMHQAISSVAILPENRIGISVAYRINRFYYVEGGGMVPLSHRNVSEKFGINLAVGFPYRRFVAFVGTTVHFGLPTVPAYQLRPTVSLNYVGYRLGGGILYISGVGVGARLSYLIRKTKAIRAHR